MESLLPTAVAIGYGIRGTAATQVNPYIVEPSFSDLPSGLPSITEVDGCPALWGSQIFSFAESLPAWI